MQPGFTWPMEGLAIVAPIVFITLIVLFPLIGLLAGWKRAAFWGGGTFLFFLIGLIIWKTLAPQITSPLTDLIANLIHSQQGMEQVEITPNLVQAVVAPFYFLIFMAVSELILLINYYAWYKRVVGLRKIKKVNPKTHEITKVYAKVNKKAGTVGYKIGNRLGGFLLLGALTVPSTITFTQIIYFTTTSSSTRAAKSDKTDPENPQLCLSESLYEGLDEYSAFMGWFTYFGSGSSGIGAVYDGVFSALHAITTPITDAEGNETTVMEEVEKIVGQDISQIADTLSTGVNIEPESPEAEQLAGAFDNIAKDWNNLVDKASEDVAAIFSSEIVVEQVNAIIVPIIQQTQDDEGATTGGFEITEDIYSLLFVPSGEETESKFQQVIDEYANGEILGIPLENTFKPLEVPQETFDMVKDIFTDLVILDDATKDKYKDAEEVIDQGFDALLQLLFTPKQSPQQ